MVDMLEILRELKGFEGLLRQVVAGFRSALVEEFRTYEIAFEHLESLK